MKKIILNLLDKYKGCWDDIYSAIKNRELSEDEIKNIDIPKDINYYFIIDKNYHDKFKEIIMPPIMVFWKGNIEMLDTKVLGFYNSLLKEDYDLLINNLNLFNKYTLCFKDCDLSKDELTSLLNKGFKIILVCKGGFDHLQIDKELETGNLLLISEFWDSKIYNEAFGQNLERIIFAISNDLYIFNDLNGIEKTLFNCEHKPKNIFYKNDVKDDLNKFLVSESKIIYVKNINDIN